MEAEFQDYERHHKWNEIFGNIYSMAERFPTKEASKLENKPLNRYLDVVPYDRTRVKLERHSLNYINASHVNVPSAKRKYILTQGPLKTTASHFWLMIWEQNSKAILMLNNLIERGQVKCYQYWPGADIRNEGIDANDENEITFDDVNLKVELSSVQRFDYYLLRKFKLTDLLSGDSREILHFHYTHWPDFDLPKSSDSFLEFLYAVRKSGCLDVAKHGPTVIHCSAGIGRSGTFVLVDSCLLMIEQNQCRDSINVIDVLLEMRKYRMGLIQTAGQLRFSFQTILEGSKKIILDDQSNNSNCGTKIMRSFGVDEEEDDVEGDVAEEGDEEDESIILDEANLSKQEATELRQRKREEKRRKTLDTIKQIKRKQKQVEERLKFNQRIYKYFTPIFCVGVAICVGVFIFVKKRDSVLQNYE